jgi:uncharacterized protein YdiU (UPF0061 family)
LFILAEAVQEEEMKEGELGLTKLRYQELESLSTYEQFAAIDGRHPLQEQVPFSYVLYRARRRPGGKVAYFNFALAKEMGLIESAHPHELNHALQEKLLETFALIIINEYDIKSKRRFPPHEMKDHHYMATRYLQLQHPDKRGLSSGDGRSIWNGTWTRGGRTWDLSSCGTGATCLSPATTLRKTFFRSGDPRISYGCGYAKLHEGLVDVIFSEILHRNGHRTERVLCVIEFAKGFAITVRAGENLLRPSHFFLHLKQNRWDRLKALVDYHIDRQGQNGHWSLTPGVHPYRTFLQSMTRNFAEAAARFEADYIFCWMEWDGDNILADGGIIDYGSIRQFGLFFHEYRFDDHERWSTNLKQQRFKARYTIQTFVQMIDFLMTGEKRPIESYAKSRELKDFDRLYREYSELFLLRRLGFDRDEARLVRTTQSRPLRVLMRQFVRLERAKASRGRFRVPDGENCHVLYSMRGLVRLLAERGIKGEPDLQPMILLKSIQSKAVQGDPALYKGSHQQAAEAIQVLYRQLINRLAVQLDRPRDHICKKIFQRAALINREDRVTGDAVCILSDHLLRLRRKLSPRQFHKLIEFIIRDQVLNPDHIPSPYLQRLRSDGVLEPWLKRAMKVVHSYREGL